MSTKSTRAARSPRAATPKGGRPWYAPRPRWCAVADGLGAFLMRRERTPYNVRPIARCRSLDAAEKLAAALNREERASQQAGVLRHECALRRDVLCDLVEDLHLPRFRRPPAIRECVWDQVERLREEGGRR